MGNSTKHDRSGSYEPKRESSMHEWQTTISQNLRWPYWVKRQSRLKTCLTVLLLFTLLLFRRSTYFIPSTRGSISRLSNLTTTLVVDNVSGKYAPALADAVDTFAGFRYREECNLSSTALCFTSGLRSSASELQRELCNSRATLLNAMSSGGRIGFDSPYVPRNCDMRWFRTSEVCEILSRFEKVVLVGDSMLRHVVGAINVLVREDLGYGAVTNWNFDETEQRECFCNEQFDVKACSVQGIYTTADVEKHDPESLACPLETINVQIEQINQFPIPLEERKRLEIAVTATSSKPTAFILGHGLWSDLSLGTSVKWLDAVLGIIRSNHQHHSIDSLRTPRILFISPNSAGKQKPMEWRASQGSDGLIVFEEGMRTACGDMRREIDFLGTWNMSIQATKYDGVHMDMRGNLLKAMMVVNWLSMLEA